MTLALTEEKMKKVILKCQNLLSFPETIVLELTTLIGLMSSSVPAVLLAHLQPRYLQQQQKQFMMIVGARNDLEHVESGLLTFPLFFVCCHVILLCFKC